jgi:hypothetical protein
MSVANSIVTLTGSAGTFTTTADSNGFYSISVPVGTYTMRVTPPNEAGFKKTFTRALLVDVDEPTQVTRMVYPIVDVDADSGTDAVVDLYFLKESVLGVQDPVSGVSSLNNDRTDGNGNGAFRVQLTITPAMFVYTSSEVSPVLSKIKIKGLPVTGTLLYNGIIVSENQEISVIAGTSFSGALVYASNQDIVTANNDVFYYEVKTVASTNFG